MCDILLHVSHLSHLQRVGAPVPVAQRRAGHSTPSITLQAYTTAQADEQRDPVRRIVDELLPLRAALDRHPADVDRSGHRTATSGTDRGAPLGPIPPRSGMGAAWMTFFSHDPDEAADEKC